MPFDVKPFLTNSDTRVLATKTFFHENLILCVLYDTKFDFWSVDILRVNSRQWHNLHGMFTNKDAVMEKFNNIRL